MSEVNQSSSAAAVAALRTRVAFVNHENSVGQRIARALLSRPHTEWIEIARIERDVFSYGVLDYLLDAAHDELDAHPKRAYLLTLIVLRRRSVRAPSPMLVTWLRGRAWKEHGNALHALGHLPAALAAATRAVRILSADGVLLVERTAALMLKGILLHQLEKTREGATLLRECHATFERLGEERRALQVAILEASLLYDAGELEAARSAFLDARATADRLHETRELTRILNNLADCEAQLGNVSKAKSYLRAALAGFDKEGMTAERQRVFWILARMRRDEGDFDAAIAELLGVRRNFISRGMLVEGALAGLDLVEMLAAIQAHDEVQRVAAELLEVFTAAGLQQNARLALAYLAEQARLRNEGAPLQEDLRRVRSFFHSLSANPRAEFEQPVLH